MAGVQLESLREDGIEGQFDEGPSSAFMGDAQMKRRTMPPDLHSMASELRMEMPMRRGTFPVDGHRLPEEPEVDQVVRSHSLPGLRRDESAGGIVEFLAQRPFRQMWLNTLNVMRDKENILSNETSRLQTVMRAVRRGFSMTHVEGLSLIGEKIVEVLRSKHRFQRERCWNVATGTILNAALQTPSSEYFGQIDTPETHSLELANCYYDLISKAEKLVDVTSLGPPDGEFEQQIKAGLEALATSGKEVLCRFLFGHIIGMHVDCDDVLERLTKDIPPNSKITVWIGAYRKGVSWNHSKIMAIDGKHLWQGGHNFWSDHYLKWNPVHDVSMVAEGPITMDAHRFADELWQVVARKYVSRRVAQCRACTGVFKKLAVPVSCVKFPDEPPYVPPCDFDARVLGRIGNQNNQRSQRNQAFQSSSSQSSSSPSVGNRCMMIPVGRMGSLPGLRLPANPADVALSTLLRCARESIKLSLQDLGPLTLMLPRKVNQPIPGGKWPESTLNALADAIWRGVHVHLVLSQPYSVPGPCKPLAANYGNGWTAADTAAEIVKALMKLRKKTFDEVRDAVEHYLHCAYICRVKGRLTHANGASIGNHSKLFMVDDRCYYIGSQNLYVANLAEWGIIVDDQYQARTVLDTYWDPMWRECEWCCCGIDEIRQEVTRKRQAKKIRQATKEEKAQALEASMRSSMTHGRRTLCADEIASTFQMDEDTVGLAMRSMTVREQYAGAGSNRAVS
eukprot:TRINITY_DN18088_c0_g1_i5.p1 TRINITY_DN18088_c0_g1~~TRINITY_DN18088_c0_g1_i5.p1  ORF type:complete len:734 (+),score=131.67 TRINITY_DN18088_c0_g1_i5:104-2305(+)